jgi:DNA-binding XRE family transcriptional regulator
MNKPVQTINTPGGETLVILPIAEYDALIEALRAATAKAGTTTTTSNAMDALSATERAALAQATTSLAFWRRKRNLTQLALAAAVGVSQSYLAQIEGGSRRGDPPLFLRLARALRIPMEFLVDDRATPTRSSLAE